MVFHVAKTTTTVSLSSFEFETFLVIVFSPFPSGKASFLGFLVICFYSWFDKQILIDEKL